MDRLDISQDVLGKIRGLCRKTGETEDRLLHRLLKSAAPTHFQDNAEDGFTDATYAIHFPAGFEIFRNYKGRIFSARVFEGRWMLDFDDRSYDSLNQLSQGVIDGNENAWNFWFYLGPDGMPQRIAELRDPALVQKRPRRRTAMHKTPPARLGHPGMNQASSTTPGMPWEPHKPGQHRES